MRNRVHPSGALVAVALGIAPVFGGRPGATAFAGGAPDGRSFGYSRYPARERDGAYLVDRLPMDARP